MASGLPSGSHVGPYRILDKLGEGGMGEVYRAHDPRLRRDVAIKVLSSAFQADRDRLLRFEREARILAQLDHQHIASILGVEDLGSGKALVLEYVDGPTLAERIARGSLDPREALTIARQIADAVENAHEQGVIHRDLKPANIKLRRDGAVKVLDFGLARADGSTPAAADTATITAVATREGVVMGTAAYMSPEQARGRQVDKRTDVWAFGCILFEMLCGRRAFAGDGTTETLARVLQQEPDWQALPPGIPRGIRALIARCLQKDPRQRLRDIGDARLLIDEALADPPESAVVPAEPFRRGRLLTGAIALAAASAIATYALTVFTSKPADEPVFDRFVRLVATSAHEFSPAIAPDGKWVAYLSNARGPTDIWLKSVSGGDPVNLTAPLNLEVQTQDTIGGLEISPDGTQLAFAAEGTTPSEAATYVIPVPLGGTPRRILQGRQGMRWSPDGTRITYVRPGGAFGDSLCIADADGQNEREIVKHQSARHIHWPRWAADGQHVYFNYGYPTGNGEPTEVFRVASTGGVPEPVVLTARRAVFPLPSPDRRRLFFAANRHGVEASLWQRDLSGSRDRRVTSGIGEYGTSSVSADGRRLVVTVSELRQSLLRIPVAGGTPAVPEAMTGGFTGDMDPSVSPDGTRIAFSSTRSGSRNIWWALADLSRPVALTTDAWIDEGPVYSPDGSQVAFVSDRGGRRGIWVISADGGTPRHVAAAQVLHTVSWSPDGKRLVFSAPGAELPQIHTVDVHSGKLTQLPTPAAANSPVWSPTEDVIAFLETTPGAGAFVRFMTGDGKLMVRGPIDTVTRLNNGFVRWSPDGRRLAGVGIPGNRHAQVWIIDPLGAVPFRKLVDLAADTHPRGASWSRDGTSVVVGQSRTTGDIVLAERSR